MDFQIFARFIRPLDTVEFEHKETDDWKEAIDMFFMFSKNPECVNCECDYFDENGQQRTTLLYEAPRM